MSHTQLFRRKNGRVPLSVMYNELVRDRARLGVIVDASEDGLRVERVLSSTHNDARIVQLEFELPGSGEVIWAKGEICFDSMWRPPESSSTLVRASGVRVVAAAQKHLRLLRDFVRERLQQSLAPVDPHEDNWLMRAH